MQLGDISQGPRAETNEGPEGHSKLETTKNGSELKSPIQDKNGVNSGDETQTSSDIERNAGRTGVRSSKNEATSQSKHKEAVAGDGHAVPQPKSRRGKKGKGLEESDEMEERPDAEGKEEVPRGKSGPPRARGGRGRGMVPAPKKPQRGQKKEKDDGAGAVGANVDELEEGGGLKWAKDQSGCILMLVGQAGSGKSYFASALAEGKEGWVVVEGTPKDCEVSLMRAMFGKGIHRGPQKVVLDRGNLEPEERKNWLKLAMVTKSQAMAIFFDIPMAECRQRLVERGEPITSSQGWTKGAIAPPTLKEGFKEVFRVHSIEEVEKLIRYYKAPSQDASLQSVGSDGMEGGKRGDLETIESKMQSLNSGVDS